MTLSQRIWRIGNFITLMLALLTLRLVYWQLVRGQDLQPVALDPVKAAAHYLARADGRAPEGEATPDMEQIVAQGELPRPVVQRTGELLAGIIRGSIYDRNGRPLAYNLEGEGGQRLRFYTEPSLAHTVGYVSGLGVGAAGIEHNLNQTLLGLDRLDAQVGQLIHQPITGSDVTLTIDSLVQRAAAQALGGRPGAVVALEADTGEVLAMVSAPGFDPNRILEQEYVQSLIDGCNDQPGCRSPLFNRAAQGLYTPGSTWKTVTLIGALDTGRVTRDTVFDFGEPRSGPNGSYYVYEVGGAAVIDPNHAERKLDLTRSYAVSANAAFARMGDEMGAETLIEYAARLGFSREEGGAPPIEIDASASRLANDLQTLYSNDYFRAVTAIGQGELLATPLGMALVVTAVVNDGDIPAPHLLQTVHAPSGRLIQGGLEGDWIRNTMQPETARQVREMMIAVVTSGSGRSAAVPGLTVGGKTGTAQLGDTMAPHAWFTGFASDGTRTVAIAVIVENSGVGAQVAAPIFAQVADAALRHPGEPVQEIVSPIP